MNEKTDKARNYIGTDEDSEAVELAWKTVEDTISREKGQGITETRKSVAETGNPEKIET